MSFHVVEIFTHIRFAKHVSRLFVMFVIIDPLDQYGTTVYQELITPDFQFAEAYPERNNFGCFSRLLDTDKEQIQIRGFGCPCCNLGYFRIEMNGSCRIYFNCAIPFRYTCSRGIFQLIGYRDLSRVPRIRFR